MPAPEFLGPSSEFRQVLDTYSATAARIRIDGGELPGFELATAYLAYLVMLQHPEDAQFYEQFFNPQFNAHGSIPALAGQPKRPAGMTDLEALVGFCHAAKAEMPFLRIEGRWLSDEEIEGVMELVDEPQDLTGVVGARLDAIHQLADGASFGVAVRDIVRVRDGQFVDRWAISRLAY